MQWSTALPDWETRIVARQSLVPLKPLFPVEAEASLDVFRSLRIVDVAGSPTFGDACDDWVFDFVGAIFGSYDHASAQRLIQEFFLLISKKNAKSTIAAGIMVTALIRNWRHSAELLILAPTLEVANNSYRPAADMVRADPDLTDLLHIQDNFRQITHRRTKATLKVVAADAEVVGGKKAAFVLVDELWQFGPRANADAMLQEATGGLVARPEGFVVYLSTQSDTPPKGVFEEKLKHFRDVRDGKVVDPVSLGVLYEFPQAMLKSQAYLDPANFYITNPNIGRSVKQKWLERKLIEKSSNPASKRIFLAKHLNVEIGQALRADGWAGANIWERGIETGLTLDAVLARSEVVTVGFDGGGLDDLFGCAAIGRERETKRWLGWTHALISPEGMERRKANATLYERFIADGDLTLIEHLPQDQDYAVALVQRILEAGLLAQVGVDAAGIGGLVDELGKIGVTQDAEKLGAVRQGIALMGAIKTIERKLADRTFRHAGSAMMGWCVGNAIIVPTPTAMRIDRAESGFGKIDPLMALFNAAALMAMNPQNDAVSVPANYRMSA